MKKAVYFEFAVNFTASFFSLYDISVKQNVDTKMKLFLGGEGYFYDKLNSSNKKKTQYI